jgi:hypothetical protein
MSISNSLFLGTSNSKLAVAICEALDILGVSHDMQVADVTSRLKSAAKNGKYGIPTVSFPLTEENIDDVFAKLDKHLHSADYYPDGHSFNSSYFKESYIGQALHEAESPELRLVSWTGADNQWNHPGIVSTNTRYKDVKRPELTLDLSGWWFIQALYATLKKNNLFRLPLPWAYFVVWFATESGPDSYGDVPSGYVCEDGQSRADRYRAYMYNDYGFVCVEGIYPKQLSCSTLGNIPPRKGRFSLPLHCPPLLCQSIKSTDAKPAEFCRLFVR